MKFENCALEQNEKKGQQLIIESSVKEMENIVSKKSFILFKFHVIYVKELDKLLSKNESIFI